MLGGDTFLEDPVGYKKGVGKRFAFYSTLRTA